MQPTHTTGFSLIEILSATLLGSLLLMVLIEVYISVKTSYLFNSALTHIQQQGQLAIYLLNNKIHAAGFNGCQKGKPYVNQAQAVQGYTSETVPRHWGLHSLPGADILIIGECQSYHGKQQFVQEAFFIGDTYRKNQAGEPIYALFSKTLSSERVELIPGIENMKLRYGVSKANGLDVEKYLTAKQIQDWKMVRSIQLALVLNSVESILKKSKPYVFNGETLNPKDKMLHKAWYVYSTLRLRG